MRARRGVSRRVSCLKQLVNLSAMEMRLLVKAIGRYSTSEFYETCSTRGRETGACQEVLQLCSHLVIGWPDASTGLFGLRSVQAAPI
jgi:hypothetical protein